MERREAARAATTRRRPRVARIAAPPPVPPQARERSDVDGRTLEPLQAALLDRIYFAHNEVTLDEAQAQLEAVVKLARQAGNEDLVVIIRGRADAGEHAPLELSRERAARVQRYLIQGGVASVRVQVEALGDQDPEERAHAEPAGNQCVEIRVVVQ